MTDNIIIVSTLKWQTWYCCLSNKKNKEIECLFYVDGVSHLIVYV